MSTRANISLYSLYSLNSLNSLNSLIATHHRKQGLSTTTHLPSLTLSLVTLSQGVGYVTRCDKQRVQSTEYRVQSKEGGKADPCFLFHLSPFTFLLSSFFFLLSPRLSRVWACIFKCSKIWWNENFYLNLYQFRDFPLSLRLKRIEFTHQGAL